VRPVGFGLVAAPPSARHPLGFCRPLSGFTTPHGSSLTNGALMPTVWRTTVG